MIVEYSSRLMFDLVEHQGEVAAIREEPPFRKIGSLWPPELPIAAECPLTEGLYRRKLPSKPSKLWIEIGIPALCEHRLIQ